MRTALGGITLISQRFDHIHVLYCTYKLIYVQKRRNRLLVHPDRLKADTHIGESRVQPLYTKITHGQDQYRTSMNI
jgi:hypothetical protein